MTGSKTELLVIGGSAGSLEVILKAFNRLESAILEFAIIIVLHRKSGADNTLIELLESRTTIPVSEANEKEPILSGHIYIAPADYHLLVESDRSMSLDYSEKVNFSRPCIDITFQTAAEVYGENLVCLLLSGASADGSEGMETAKALKSHIVVQDPVTAEVSYMPQKAIERVAVDRLIPGNDVGEFILTLHKNQ